MFESCRAHLPLEVGPALCAEPAIWGEHLTAAIVRTRVKPAFAYQWGSPRAQREREVVLRGTPRLPPRCRCT